MMPESITVYATIVYEKQAEIGTGQGMNSRVYAAWDPQMRTVLAVKEIELEDIAVEELDGYFQEAAAMRAAQHSNVVPIQYACRTDTHVALAMPLYERGSLADRIKTGPLTVREVIRVGQGMLLGLSQVHVANFIHFDLKPSNVLFNDRDQPLVSDFGQARFMDFEGIATAPPLYPFGFIPEALEGVGSIESDIYQAGLTLYRAVNGDPIYYAQLPATQEELIQKVMRGKFPSRDRFLPHVPDRLRTIIRRALNVDPTRRYHSAMELAEDLGRVAPRLDWSLDVLENQDLQWQAERKGRPTIVVLLRKTGHQYGVSVYTETNGVRRKRDVEGLWRNQMSAKEADEHLRGVFKALS